MKNLKTPQLLGVAHNGINLNTNLPKVFAVTDAEWKKITATDMPTTIEVRRKKYMNNDLATSIEVYDKINYEVNDYPFIVQKLNPIISQVKPFYTYKQNETLTVSDHPFITQCNTGFYVNKNAKRKWFLQFYNPTAHTVIRCKLYESMQGFPIKDTALVCKCGDGKIRYAVIDKPSHEFDSGGRCQDSNGNIYQICTGRQINVINAYCPNGNILIPLKSYDYLYNCLKGIFGSYRVQKTGDSIYFIPPSTVSGVSQIFCIGLNIQFTNEADETISTYYDGLNQTSFGGDLKRVANSMLVKMHHRHKIKINFSNTYEGTSYPEENLLKNCLIIGSDVEKLSDRCDSYDSLLYAGIWKMYDQPTNSLKSISLNSPELTYLKEKYLNYRYSPRKYNYYDLADMSTVYVK